MLIGTTNLSPDRKPPERSTRRTARVVVPGCPHHVVQRGNNRQDVFFSDGDRTAYLEVLKNQAGRYGLSLEGYCLMTNHVHIIATPEREESLARVRYRC